jgi:hypothetical protein
MKQMKKIKISSFMGKQPLFEYVDFEINPNKKTGDIFSWKHK